jgi:ABC-type transport system involved in multi-copper enzyme maturation permease subunit
VTLPVVVVEINEDLFHVEKPFFENEKSFCGNNLVIFIFYAVVCLLNIHQPPKILSHPSPRKR